ncbi:hypothetical protein [Kribbella deserti]|uniref:Uncharacterized protein n=1 Tax=Kribbella deserti TaxID=1926257 RepID=A0ABV6QFB2_9ACTN
MSRTGKIQIGLVAVVVAAMSYGGWYLIPRHHSGPLGTVFENGTAGARLCMPVGEAVDVTYGVGPLNNTSSSTAVITDVDLVDAHNLEHVVAILVPFDKVMVGSKVGWTYGQGPWGVKPADPLLATGALLPGKEEKYQLVMRLTRPDVLGESRAEGIRVEYRVGMRRFVSEYGPSQLLRPGRCH